MANENKATAVAKYTVDDVAVIKGLSSEEQETTVQMSRTEDVAYVWTSDNVVVTKIKKLMERAPDQWKLVKISTNAAGEPVGYFFECPKKLVSFRTLRAYDENDKAAIAARLASGRVKNDADTDDDE